jgi:hypothetical protein
MKTSEKLRQIPNWQELGPLKDTDDQQPDKYLLIGGTYPIPAYRSKKNLKYSK